MASYRVKLDSIKCIQPRSAGQYHDTITVFFYATPAGKTPADAMQLKSPLGIRHPSRMNVHFGPGSSHTFKRNDTAFGYGQNFDWELRVDLPDDSTANWDVGIVVWNDRDIDDPFAVTKLITALTLAAAGGAAGLALAGGQEKTLGAFIAAAAKGVGGEVIKKIVESFFAEWPKCQGIVFRKDLVWNPANFGENVGSMTLTSDEIDTVPDGCRQPEYQVGLTVESLWIPQFGTSDEVRTKTYYADKAPAKKRWNGRWYESLSAPMISVGIEPSAQGGPSDYRVAVREEAPYRRSRRTVIDGIFDPVPEVTRYDLPYTGRIVNAQATGKPVGSVSEGIRTERSLGQRSIATTASIAALSQEAGSLLMRGELGSDLLSTFRGQDSLTAIWSGEAMTTFNDPSRVDLDTIEEVVGAAFTESGATLYIPEIELVLRLYEVEEELETGLVRRWGPILRYFREARAGATLADVQMGRYKLVL